MVRMCTKDKEIDKQLRGYNSENRSDEKIVKNKDKDDHSTIEASIFGGLESGDIIWEENDREVEKNNQNKGTKRKAPPTQTGPSEAKRGIELQPERPRKKNHNCSDIAYINSFESLNGMGVPCALMDTRFLPGRVGNEPLTRPMLKSIYDAFRKSQFSKLLNLPKMWTFIGTFEDAKLLQSSLCSIFLDKEGFTVEEAYYKPHCDEEIKDNSSFFDRSLLILLHVFWPEENENKEPTVSRPIGTCAMKQFHIAEDLPRYMFPHMVKMEQEHVLFKEELRFQSYMDIIGPVSIPNATFLNICGGNKPHLVATAYKMKILSIVPRELLSEATKVSQKVFH